MEINMLKKIFVWVVITSIMVASIYLVKQYLAAQLTLLVLAWLAFFGLEYALNGGTIRRCFPEELSLYGFSGEQNRTAFAKKQLLVDYDSTICGSKKTWYSREKHTEEQYVECGNDILGKGYYFWASKCIIPLGIALYLVSRSL
jgi:hypothetical protein